VANQRRRVLWVATLLLAITLVLAVLYEGFVFTPYDLRIIRQDIPCAGFSHGPVRVLLLSDVDFPRYRSNLDRAAEAARAFDPDLVFVAGDFLDRASALRDPEVRQAASVWFDSLPARGRRLLAPGEEESPAIDRLKSSWSPEVIEPLANESRQFEIRGERLDVFVADDRTDPAPWRVFRDGDRWTAGAKCRRADTYVQLARPDAGAWRDVEVTLALRLGLPDGGAFVRLLANPDSDPRVSEGLLIVHDEHEPGFRLVGRWPGSRVLSGRVRSAYVPRVGSWTRGRIQVVDEGNTTRIKARFWTEGGDEPTHWMIDAEASGPGRRRQGTIALGGRRGGVQFADVAVTDGTGRLLLREAFDDRNRFLSEWKQWSRLGAWLASPPDGATRLLLAHTPDIALDVEAWGGVPPSAILAGHTHGGQVSLPWLGPVYTATHLGRSFDRGLFRVAGSPLFITAGVGTSIVPIRLGVPPDVALLTFLPGVSSGP